MNRHENNTTCSHASKLTDSPEKARENSKISLKNSPINETTLQADKDNWNETS